VRDDPSDDYSRIRALGEDGGTLDDLPARGVRPGEPGDYGTNRVVVHGYTPVRAENSVTE